MTNAVISARVDSETLALVDRVTKAQGRSRSWFAAQAIKRAAEEEAELLAFIQEGIDDIERGNVVDGDEVIQMLDQWIDEFRAQCRKD